MIYLYLVSRNIMLLKIEVMKVYISLKESGRLMRLKALFSEKLSPIYKKSNNSKFLVFKLEIFPWQNDFHLIKNATT